MVQIDLVYQGDLRVEAQHGPSKVKLTTDAPLDNQGKGESFSPSDLVATALASCMATIMGIVAKRHQIDLVGMKMTVKKHMVQSPARRIGLLEVFFDMPQVTDESMRKLLERAALTCPVYESLNPEVEKKIQFNWG